MASGRPTFKQTLSSGSTSSFYYEDYHAVPLMPQTTYPGSISKDNLTHLPLNSEETYPPLAGYDTEHAVTDYEGLPYSSNRPATSRSSSWSVLSSINKLKQDYEDFNPKDVHLPYADGDIPKNKLVRLYYYLLSFSIITRWLLFIVPLLAILWIPGILHFTRFPNAEVWGVGLLWWSIWLSVVWLGWWIAFIAARILPPILKNTIGLMAVGTRRYIDWLTVLTRYVAFFSWCLGIWICYGPLIFRTQNKNADSRSVHIITTMQKLLLVFVFCAAGLLFEKVLIQWIASKFHEKSYADRIANQKFAVKVLVTLYSKSRDIPGRTDTLRTPNAARNRDPTRRFIKQVLKDVRVAATSTTMALGNVASEIAGSSVLQPNSPSAIIQVVLESPNKSRLLARRLFYSFAKHEATSLLIGDIADFFPNQEDAEAAFALFDRDSNRDVTRDELELACIGIRHEQLSIEHSMRAMDSAVGRLDNLLISVYTIGAVGLTVAVALQAQLVALLSGVGAIFLGMTWLIAASLQEVLASIIFLFIKHPFDVGDRVNILKEYYTVKEMHLLSTIFLDSQGCFVQVPNVVLNTTYIQNLCRSSQMSESFSFDVDYGTTFEQLEELRDKMLTFLKTQKRDFFPIFDVAVVDFPNQEKLSLTADIKYKSNWQRTTLKTRRRNKWICALKAALADVKVFGTKGNPKAVRHPDQHTIVPWEEVKAEQEAKEKDGQQEKADASDTPKMPAGGWKLLEDNDLIQSDTGDVFCGPTRLV